jgi:hypothetical protein
MLRTRAKKAQQETIAPDVYPTEAASDEAADHGLHVTDATCIRCSGAIRPNDEVRKTLKGDCVHISC